MWFEEIKFNKFVERKNWKADLQRHSLPDEPDEEYKKISDLANFISDTTEPSDFNKDIYIGLQNIKSNACELINLKSVEEQNIKSRSKKCIKGDVLLGRLRPNLNKVCVVDLDFAICSSEIFVLRPHNLKHSSILWAYLSSERIQKYFESSALGSTLPRVSAENVMNLKISQKHLNLLSRRDEKIRNKLDDIKSLQADFEKLKNELAKLKKLN